MRTVFHHSDPDQHEHVLANVDNLLDDDSLETKSVAVVANAGGVHLLRADGDYAERVRDLLDDVEFVACRNSLETRDIDASELVEGVETAQSGVGELTRLQGRGYAYIKD